MERAGIRALPGRLLLLALFALSAGGCGNKGPVRPLELRLPVVPPQMTVVQKGARFLLAWDLPTRNQDGSIITDLQGFRIYRMRYDLDKDCPECRDNSALEASLDLDYLQGAQRSGDRIFFWDKGLEPGFGYQYRVVPFNRSGREGLGALERLPFVTPPAPPKALAATGHDRLVRLTWEGAAGEDPEGEFLGYNLYRGEAGVPLPPLPFNRSPVVEERFDDFGLENGRSYRFGVRRVMRILGRLVESPLSERVEATPVAGR